MPAIITHDLFGKDVYGETFDIIGGSRDAAEAFLLGNQGPDPFCSSSRPIRATAAWKAGLNAASGAPGRIPRGPEERCARAAGAGALRRTRLRAGLCVPLPAGQHGASTRHKPGERLVHRRWKASRPRTPMRGARRYRTELDELVLTGQARRDRGHLPPRHLGAAPDATACWIRGAPVRHRHRRRLRPHDAQGHVQSAVRAERAAQRALYSPTGAKRAVSSPLPSASCAPMP
ncbi:MAG: hypothetical protein ACLTDR_15265 [Adlercreutzia equolifaciens]